MENDKTFIQSALFLTRRCNLRCKYCKVPERSHRDEMDTDGVKETMRLMKEIGFDLNVLFGGEPLLRNDIIPLIEYANEIDLPYALISNSTLLTHEMCIKLSRAGLRNYTASVDTFSLTDLRSDHGLAALIRMKAAGVPDVVGNIVIHKDNLFEIPNIVRNLTDYGIWVILGIIQDAEQDSDEPWEYRSKNGLGLINAPRSMVEKVADSLLKMKNEGRRIHNVASYFENMSTLGRTLDWKCKTPAYIPIDEDGSLMCCVDWRGASVEASGYTLKDLLDPQKRQSYIIDREVDVGVCPGCYYNHSWQVEHLGDFDLTHADSDRS